MSIDEGPAIERVRSVKGKRSDLLVFGILMALFSLPFLFLVDRVPILLLPGLALLVLGALMVWKGAVGYLRERRED